MEGFNEALDIVGYRPGLSYNAAICYFQLKAWDELDKVLNTIISKSAKENPEFMCGNAREMDSNVQSVGNSQALKESALIEAFNLRCAREFLTGDSLVFFRKVAQNISKKNKSKKQKIEKNAKICLLSMPPREESELDPVTLHNHALLNIGDDLNESFRKFNFLLQSDAFPPPTFSNLLLLYVANGLHHLAADVLAENTHLHENFLSNDLYDFLEATITAQTSPVDAYRKFEVLSRGNIDNLRKITKLLNETRKSGNSEKIQDAIQKFLEALDAFIRILMAQSNIFWEKENYEKVEKLLESHREFAGDHEIWRLNLAHTLFMESDKYKECLEFYEPLVRAPANAQSILEVNAMVLANLCVSWIMVNENDEAEEMMRELEKAEENALREDPSIPRYHLCIVNLVIGTLYCAKGNYSFGLARVMKSLAPLNKKLSMDTWLHAKRCFLSYLEIVAKQIVPLKDTKFEKIMQFLDDVEVHGRYELSFPFYRVRDLNPGLAPEETRMLTNYTNADTFILSFTQSSEGQYSSRQKYQMLDYC